MSQTVESTTGLEPGLDSLETVGTRAQIAVATGLARQGAYLQAEEVIRNLPRYESDPAALDLLARICAQQGRLAEAEKNWAMAQRLEPGNPAFGRGVEYLGRLRRSVLPVTLRLEPAFILLVAVVVAVLLGGLALQLRSMRSQLAAVSSTVLAIQAQTPAISGPQANPVATAVPEGASAASNASEEDVLLAVQTQQAELSGIRADMSGIRSSQDELEKLLSEEAAAPEIGIEHPLVVVVPHQGSLNLQFKEGLFLYGAVLRPEARVALIQVGQQLEPYVDRIRVDLVGYQANDETGGLFDLGMMRAMVVFRLLQEETQLPARVLSVRTGWGEPAPYPNDSPLNRSRNRTVIWIVSAAD
jgi:flagellar motor protein MotB